jgi:hypothetical protein
MTDLTKPVRRVARNVIHTHGIRPDVVVTLYPGGVLGLREHGRRKEYSIPLDAVLTLAIRREVEETRRLKGTTRRRGAR